MQMRPHQSLEWKVCSHIKSCCDRGQAWVMHALLMSDNQRMAVTLLYMIRKRSVGEMIVWL